MKLSIKIAIMRIIAIDTLQYEYKFKNKLHSMNEAIYVHMEHKVSMRHKPVAFNLYIIF